MHRIPVSVLCSLILVIVVAKSGESTVDVHIVYTERPEDEEPEAFHLRTLSNILGSDAAAKESMIQSYSKAVCGFSAKLSPDQVQRLSREPGILQIVPSQTYQLHEESRNRRR